MQIMKNIKDDLNTSNLIERLGYANTPAYLYKHYRQDQTVYDLSKSYSIEDLVNYLKDNLNNVKSIEDLVVVYATIISLTFKDEKDVKDIFIALKGSPLRW